MAISIQDKVGLTCDNVPTQNSDNAVKSGGVFTALQGKQDADKAVVIDTNVYTGVVVADGGSAQAAQINFLNKNDSVYDMQAFNINQNVITKYVRRKSDQQWIADATFTADEDTGWLKLEAYKTGFEAGGYGIDYRRKNGWCIIQITVRTTEAFAVGAGKTIATLPAGFRPSTLVNFSLSIGNNVADAHDVIGYAHPDGRIDSLYRFGNIPSGAYLLGSVSFPV